MKKFKDFALFLLIILSIFIITICLTYNYNLSPVGHNNKMKEVVIKNGKDIDSIIKVLREQYLIRNPKVFKIYLNIFQIKQFKVGTFKLNESMSSKEIVDILKKD